MPDGVAQVVRVGERTVRLTNPDKVLFPESGTTKAELVDYYSRIAPVMLPHLLGRPVTRKRWPHGTGTGGGKDAEPFFTKNLDSGTPDWVPRAAIVHHERTVHYPLVQEEATLVWCAQMAAIELHVPQWRLPQDVLDGVRPYVLDTPTSPPDRLVVDLDPGPGVGLEECCEVALAARELLDSMGLPTVPVTSGSKGLHLYAGLSGVGADGASAFASELADALAAELPALAITQMKRSLREGRVFVDHTQNNAAKTTVAPYSVRGRELPWVATPRTWDEIEIAHGGGEPLRQLRIEDVLERAGDGDPFAPLLPDDPRGAPKREVAREPASPAARTSGSAPAAPAPARTRPAAEARGERGATHAVGNGKVDEAARRRTLPPSPEPMLATHHDPFVHARLDPERWAFEPKWDGYRAIVTVAPDGERDPIVRLTARSGRDVTGEFAAIAGAPAVFRDHAAVLDAEIVALDAASRPSFHALQERASTPRPPLRLVVFDVLRLDDVDVTSRPLSERRAVLEALDLPLGDPTSPDGVGPGEHGWLTSAVLTGTLPQVLEASEASGGEGVMAKRRDSPYQPGRRSGAWVKVKHQAQARVVVGGWRPGQGRREGGIGSLLLGVREDDGRLRYVGKVGTGFSDAELDRLGEALEPLRADASPFDTPVPRPEERVAVWVRPEVVGEVAFDSWTPDGVLRAARWQGRVAP